MTNYLVFLRGINVGGNSLIGMAKLREALADVGLERVRTYIQSGNVVFSSSVTDQVELANIVHDCIKRQFGHDVAVVIFTEDEWRAVIAAAPDWWGKDEDWKHNILIVIPPFVMDDIVATIGGLKPEIEAMLPGKGVLYQSISRTAIGRGVTGSKIVSSPVYKQLTIRNYNTATKLLTFMERND